ncbi:8998_t:CDS:10 [Scutellospora calospora]|uniref:8998_t:CDS:1 n=1 Tax=Scutellospora calospora TaxID=85575 RepID=A0ACA9K3F7_9GLOM|nr:8998_t:CDS:10 [Scutellospora calospora]
MEGLDNSSQSTSTTVGSSKPYVHANASNVNDVKDFTLSDESQESSPVFDSRAEEFDQLTLSAAESLKTKLTGLDDFTFKRKHSTRATSSRIFSRPESPMKKKYNSEAGHTSTSLKKYNDDEFDGDIADWSMEGTGRRVAYDDFTTIDWIHDFAKERARQRKLRQQKGIGGRLKLIFDAMEGWIVVLIVGVISGILAAVIDITSEWLSDIKEGYCKPAFYLNRKNCCWGYDDDRDSCVEWVRWNTALQAKSAAAEFWTNYLFYIIFSTTFATIAAYLVKCYSLYSSGSGIPEIKTILGGFVIRKFLGWWTLIIKSIGVCLVAASSLCLGKEGPLIHLACCCGNIIPRIFPKFRYNEDIIFDVENKFASSIAKKREILSAAAAAGVSVAFGAPIGGVLFSLEEVSYYFPFRTMWRSFFCAMVAASMNPYRTGKLVLFQVVYDREWHGFELFFFALLGILGGLYGALFIRMNLKVAVFRQNSWLRHFSVQEVVIISLFTSIVSYLNIYMRVNPSELVANLFRECEGGDYHNLCNYNNHWEPTLLLLIASFLKFFLTIVTFGLKVPAGVWLPSIAIGACFGRAVGLIVHAWHKYNPGFWLFASCEPDVQCITPGMYAMVGAAATFGGVTRMTVSLVVIMFELTGALTYVLPIMIAVMISKWVGDAFDKEGIYDGWIRINEYPFLDSKEDYVYNTLASQYMTRVEDLMVITATGHTLDSLDELLNETDYKGFPVVNNLRNMLLTGYISRSELRYAMDKAKKKPGILLSSPCYFSSNLPILDSTAFIDFKPWMDQTPITISPKFPMEMTIELFKKMGLRYILVTQNGQLLGLITKKDVLRHLSAIRHPDVVNSEDPQEQQKYMILSERRMSGLTNDFVTV